MTHISGSERSQLLLLPERVEDYVGVDNPVRFIDAFVDGLDLLDDGFARVQDEATGRPGYDPADLLKLYLWLSEPGTFKPSAGGGGPSQYRGDLAVAAVEARLQDDCRFSP